MNAKFWKNKKVFLTGHTGFKGSWLSVWLASLGANVYGYALEPSTSPALFNILNLKNKVDHYVGDIRDLETLQKRIKQVRPDIVIHMAAQPLVRYSYKNPLETYQTNVMGTVHLLESVRDCDSVKVILNVTTDKCYENKEWVWGYREDEPLGGYDPYSNSKACSELVTSAYRNSYFNPGEYSSHGKAIASARAGNVIGGGDWAEDRLVPDILKALINNRKIEIRNPSASRPWQHVLEPLSGYLILVEKLWDDPIKYPGAWNFGPYDQDVKPVKYLVEYLTKIWPMSAGWINDHNDHPHEAGLLKLDISKSVNLLGWKPKWMINQTLNAIVNWYQAHINQADMLAKTLEQIEQYTENKAPVCKKEKRYVS